MALRKEGIMKRHLFLGVFSLAALLGNLGWAASASDEAAQRLSNSANVLKEVANARDKGPEQVLTRSKCIVVIPNLVKAGLVVGGKYGHGVAVCRTSGNPNETRNQRAKGAANAHWSAPAFITIGGGSVGPMLSKIPRATPSPTARAT